MGTGWDQDDIMIDSHTVRTLLPRFHASAVGEGGHERDGQRFGWCDGKGWGGEGDVVIRMGTGWDQDDIMID